MVTVQAAWRGGWWHRCGRDARHEAAAGQACRMHLPWTCSRALCAQPGRPRPAPPAVLCAARLHAPTGSTRPAWRARWSMRWWGPCWAWPSTTVGGWVGGWAGGRMGGWVPQCGPREARAAGWPPVHRLMGERRIAALNGHATLRAILLLPPSPPLTARRAAGRALPAGGVQAAAGGHAHVPGGCAPRAALAGTWEAVIAWPLLQAVGVHPVQHPNPRWHAQRGVLACPTHPRTHRRT